MDLIERANLLEKADLDILVLTNVWHKSGLSYCDIAKILLRHVENTIPQFEVECRLQYLTHHNQNLSP